MRFPNFVLRLWSLEFLSVIELSKINTCFVSFSAYFFCKCAKRRVVLLSALGAAPTFYIKTMVASFMSSEKILLLNSFSTILNRNCLRPLVICHRYRHYADREQFQNTKNVFAAAQFKLPLLLEQKTFKKYVYEIGTIGWSRHISPGSRHWNYSY